jgi:thiamine biosynthesis lipoprotein
LQRGERTLAQVSPDVAAVLGLCADLHLATDGYFSALAGGRLDPTGLVKGWAVERASALLRDRGSRNHAVNGGGDVQISGSPAPDRPWTVAITDPLDRSRVLTTVTGNDFAAATSGTAERGHHIVDPFTGTSVSHLVSATVIGPSLTYADAFATAAFVRGSDALRWMDGIEGYELLLAGTDDRVSMSSGWPHPATSSALLAG